MKAFGKRGGNRRGTVYNLENLNAVGNLDGNAEDARGNGDGEKSGHQPRGGARAHLKRLAAAASIALRACTRRTPRRMNAAVSVLRAESRSASTHCWSRQTETVSSSSQLRRRPAETI